MRTSTLKQIVLGSNREVQKYAKTKRLRKSMKKVKETLITNDLIKEKIKIKQVQ